MENGVPSDLEDRVVNVREALMCREGRPNLRTARFLNHTITAIDDDVFELPIDAFSSQAESFEPRKWPLKFELAGWTSPSPDWVEWVDAMAPRNEATWKKAGVYDAIMASRYQVKKDKDLVMGLVEKWCVDTNTFVFPWGEATITLEDMAVLGGFSIIGNFVSGSLKREEQRVAEEKLRKARSEIGGKGSLWVKQFMNSGNEIEHEAFVAVWLSRFVFSNPGDAISEKLFAAAVQVARGTRVALAPAVLAGIYRDLGLLKERLTEFSHFGEEAEEANPLMLMSLFHFVQIWAWERIAEVSPVPNPLNPSEPRMARWHQQSLEFAVQDYRHILDTARESFQWRPYTKALKNFKFPKFYSEKDMWVSVDSSKDNLIVSFARCLRVAKLVGLDCIEAYYPHRVAKQFGFDQDLPGMVPTSNESPEQAWRDYIRPIADGMLYVPSRLHEGDFTFRYVEWWKQSVLSLRSANKKDLRNAQLRKAKTPSSQATLKTDLRKGDEKDGEAVKSVTEIKGSKISADSKMAVKRPKAKVAEKKPEGLKDSVVSTKDSGVSKNEMKRSEGAARLSRTTKNNHVSFFLPKSPARPSNSRPQTAMWQKTLDSPVKTLNKSNTLVERKVERKGPGISLSNLRKTSIPPAKGKTSRTGNAVKLDFTTRDLNKDMSEEHKRKSDGVCYETDTDLTCKNVFEPNKAGTEQVADKAEMALSMLDQIVAEKQHVGEGGEIIYHIPKSQFEVLSKGFQEVLSELQSIKSALDISSKGSNMA